MDSEHADLLRKIASGEARERSLTAANADLLSRIADGKRPEDQVNAAAGEQTAAQVRFETAFSNAPIGMALVDMDGRWLDSNDALCRITGYTRSELEETTLRTITHPDDVDVDADSAADLLNGTIPSRQTEKRFRHASGDYVWVLLTESLVRDALGKPLHVVSQVQDIAERKGLATRLEFLIDHDFLTGLFNRQRFQQELKRETERASRYGASGAVIMIDLDNFKEVNDSFGHKAGDDLLRGVAGTLKRRVRKSDVLARVGGDEFAVLLPDADVERAQLVAQSIVKTLGRHVAVLGEQSIQVTASVGVALFDGLGAAKALEFADAALYDAKQAGRNRVAIYRHDGGPDELLSPRAAEAEPIIRALEERRFLLYCQPIVDLASNEVCQYELLLRLRAADGGEPVVPGAFLYVAERFGLIQKIDCWVARRAIELIAANGRAGRRLVLHVNLSGKSIGDPTVAARIESAIVNSGIDPACLIFELTETAALANIEEATAFAHRLRLRGCGLALDDFGAGFSSFHHLKTLPLDYPKIDGDYIRGIVASPTDQLVVRAIVGIAKGMGKKTIAEFVSDDAISRLLGEMGVDFAQGYHCGLPRPIEEVLMSEQATGLSAAPDT